jgi:hypothetical protein
MFDLLSKFWAVWVSIAAVGGLYVGAVAIKEVHLFVYSLAVSLLSHKACHQEK